MILNAAEVDSFTRRYDPIIDSTKVINDQTNAYIKEAIANVNKRGKGCNEAILYKELRKFFSNQYKGRLARFIINSSAIDKTLVKVKDSVYRDWSMVEAIVVGGWSRITDPSAALIKVNDQLIGTDKFEHFFGSGYRYFKRNYLKGKGVQAAIRIGIAAEEGLLGAWTTGVKSYGDMTANFNGMRFWNHLLWRTGRTWQVIKFR